MLIQNVSGNSVPASSATTGNGGSPVIAVAAPQTASPVELPQTAVAPVGSTQAAPPSNDQLQKALSKINQSMLQANTGLEFSIVQGSDKPLIKVVDTQTGQTIKQIPSKEVVAIGQAIDQFQQGLLVKQKA